MTDSKHTDITLTASSDDGPEKTLSSYGLKWLDVTEPAAQQLLTHHPRLVRAKELDIAGAGPEDRLIIGDNLHALTALLESQSAQVDLIYIDPPYNTGSTQFRYADDRRTDRLIDGTKVPKGHMVRHSAWLSFMERRLRSASQLMSDEATIFLSINEDEHAVLQLLCDQIFGAEHRLCTFTVKVRHEDRILKGDKDFHETTEYLLMYRKSAAFKTIKRVQDNTSIDKYVYEVEELTPPAEIVEMEGRRVEVYPPGSYRIEKGRPAADKLQKINIRGSLKDGNSSGRFHMKHFEPLRDRLATLYKVPEIGSDGLGHRYFLSREKESLLNGSYFQGVPTDRPKTKMVPYADLLDFEEAFNAVGQEGGVVFRNGKKPVDFLRFILQIGTRKKDALILDFFAGSGSTAHAVRLENNADGGTRRTILCTNEENDIAQEVTWPRLRNISLGYQLQKTVKEVLFEHEVTLGLLNDQRLVTEARAHFFSDEYQERFDTITEEVRHGRYRIVGRVKKGEQIKGLPGSLRVDKIRLEPR